MPPIPATRGRISPPPGTATPWRPSWKCTSGGRGPEAAPHRPVGIQAARRQDLGDLHRVPLCGKLGELSDGSFVEIGVNVLAFGLPGTGKTHHCAPVPPGVEPDARSLRPGLPAGANLLPQRDLALPRLRKLDNYDFLRWTPGVPAPRGRLQVLFTHAERYERRSLGITSPSGSIFAMASAAKTGWPPLGHPGIRRPQLAPEWPSSAETGGAGTEFDGTGKT